MADGEFATRDWAKGHEDLCATRTEALNTKIDSLATDVGSIAGLLKIGGSIGITVLISVAGWSLKTNWDTQQAAIAAVHQTSDETVKKLHATIPKLNTGSDN